MEFCSLKSMVANMGSPRRFKCPAMAALVLGCVAFATNGWAQQPAARGAAAPKLTAGQVDLERSRTYVHVGASGFGHEHGVEGRLLAGT
ncbi:MAG TPA: hypothetical protein VIK18_16420, partial [Pirellulales bacterium]